MKRENIKKIKAREVGKTHKQTERSRLPTVLFLALLTTVALMLLARLPGLIPGEETLVIEENQGLYDLSKLGEALQSAVLLPSGATFYPNVLLTPETQNSARPAPKESYGQHQADFLSQRFVVKLPETDRVYALQLKLSGRHGMRVFVNGEMVGQAGVPGETRQETEVWENNLRCYAAPKDGTMDIILQSAEFFHYRYGARLASLYIQDAAYESQGFDARLKGFVVMGALLCAAVLLLCLYFMHPGTRESLYFALACLSMALREGLQSQAWTAFSFLSGETSFMLEYFSMVLLTIFLSFYLGQYAITKPLKAAQLTAIGGAVLYGLCVLLGDSVFYTAVLPYFQLLLVLSIVPGIAGLLWTQRRPSPEVAVALFGILVFYLAAVSDIIMYSEVLGDVRNAPISEASMLLFVLAQTIALFLLHNRLISEAKEAERQLFLENEALENLNRLKTEFLANVSHELKTPLTVVSGHAQMSRNQLQGDENEAVREKMRIIAAEADRLALMVGQILDLTRIEEGRIRLEKRPCHLDELIYQAVETHFPILNKNGNRLEIHLEQGLPTLLLDPGRLTQVLVNLIANALHHTDHGIITVGALQNGDWVELSVYDTGAGIPPEELPKLFSRFHSPKRRENDTGTGLGLYLCKHLVEEHGGKITAESRLGEGTKMTVFLPLEEGESRA